VLAATAGGESGKGRQMPWFEIIYSEDVASRPLSSDKVVARDRSEAAATAMSGFASAQAKHRAKCYRVVDGLGLVVARGPKESSTG
jgi:hypothetical protein